MCNEIYQFKALRKLFAQPLNVVVVVKTNTATGVCAYTILFSSDLNQTRGQIIDYYGTGHNRLLVHVEAGASGVDNFYQTPPDRMLWWLSRPGLDILACVLPGQGQVPQQAVRQRGRVQLKHRLAALPAHDHAAHQAASV